MELMQKINETINFFDEMEKMQQESSDQISKIDMKEQDLLHYLENNKFKVGSYVKIAVELKKVRKERRMLKNDFLILNEFRKNILQIQTAKGREALRNIIKRQEKLCNGKYNNRIYKQEELENLIKGINQNER